MHSGHWVLHRGAQEHKCCCCPWVPGDVRGWTAERGQWACGGMGKCCQQCGTGQPAEGAAHAALFLNNDFTGIHLVLLLEAPPVPEKSPCWALLPLLWCKPGDTALQSRTLHCFLLFRALRTVAADNLTALLSWKWGFHCSLPSAGSGREKQLFMAVTSIGKTCETSPPLLGVLSNFS